jgi:hypothetical protein
LSSKINSTVEVNGTRYDALTGQMLGPKKFINKGYSSSKKMIDGFVISQPKRAKAAAVKVTAKAHNLHKRPQKSTTLMRKAVKKPDTTASQPDEHKAGQSIPQQRHNRAKTITRHEKVNRFGLIPNRSRQELAPRPAEVKINAKASYRSTAEMAPVAPSLVTSVSHKKLEQMLDEALLKANAHKHMMGGRTKNRRVKLFKRMPKWLGMTLTAVVILAVAFWLVWQNLPSVAVHVAAARAHVNAAMPTYMPEGYNFAGPLKYNQDSVTMQFKDKADKAFLLTQKASDMNSAALPANYIPANTPVETSMIGGTTVYIYGDNNNAAWVNRGVFYNLNNKAGLPSDQVLKIVQGL